MDDARKPPRARREPKRVTQRYLENAALYYLQRFSSSSANLRRVLMAKVRRSAAAHGTDPEEGARWVEALIERYRGSGLLNDQLYAESKAVGLHRRGGSTRAIRQKLAAKGLGEAEIAAAIDQLAEEAGVDGVDALNRAAAAKLARRKKIGPWRRDGRAENRDRDMAALARAGFPFDVARAVIESDAGDWED